jgi:hypothetical protein
MRCGELPPSFQPQLPWFSALDVHRSHEELERERQRRIERIHSELMSIETEAKFTRELPASP